MGTDDGVPPSQDATPCPSDNKKGVVANVATKSAAPENWAGKEKSSAKRRSEGRARLCGGAQVGNGGVGGGVAALFGWELTETAADWGGEGRRDVDGVSGGDGAGIVSVAKGEGRIQDCGGTCGGDELCTFLIVLTVRL